MRHKGFTLIELLVVIAIIAILSVIVILTLNPAQLLRQARDSHRISDMSTLKSAISVYLADVSSTSIGNVTNCYGSSLSTPTSTTGCGGRMASTDTSIAPSSTLTVGSTTGGGWIPINFAAVSAGSPFGQEPVDPINNATYFYSYATNGSPNFNFELDAHMESSKYAASGSADIESTDGGDNANAYEVGTLLTL